MVATAVEHGVDAQLAGAVDDLVLRQRCDPGQRAAQREWVDLDRAAFGGRQLEHVVAAALDRLQQGERAAAWTGIRARR